MGSMLPTGYLLVKDGVVKGEYSKRSEVSHFFGISFLNGVITFNGVEQCPTYSNEYTESEAIIDWCLCYMDKNLPSGSIIYRFIK